ncbi:hypothetical protein PInf_007517 [Phytophthora infestans]|nr:hypothetical protein PInf_007517 [Phytophthora infestans]
MYNVGKMKAMFFNSFLRLPGVYEELSARRQTVLRREAIPREPETRNRVNVVVTVVTKRTIEEGEEGAVDYVDP